MILAGVARRTSAACRLHVMSCKRWPYDGRRDVRYGEMAKWRGLPANIDFNAAKCLIVKITVADGVGTIEHEENDARCRHFRLNISLPIIAQHARLNVPSLQQRHCCCDENAARRPLWWRNDITITSICSLKMLIFISQTRLNVYEAAHRSHEWSKTGRQLIDGNSHADMQISNVKPIHLLRAPHRRPRQNKRQLMHGRNC